MTEQEEKVASGIAAALTRIVEDHGLPAIYKGVADFFEYLHTSDPEWNATYRERAEIIKATYEALNAIYDAFNEAKG